MPFYGETVHNRRPHGFIPPAQPTFFTKVKQWVHGRREPEPIPSWNPEWYTQPSPGRQRTEFIQGSSQPFLPHTTLPAARPVEQVPKKKHWRPSRSAHPVQPNPSTPPHPHPYNVPPWEREELYPYQYPVSPSFPPTLVDYKYLRLLEIAPAENTRDPELPHYHALGPGIYPVEGNRAVVNPLQKTSPNPAPRSSSARPVRRTSTPHPERSRHRSQTPPAPEWAHNKEPQTTPEEEEPIHFALGTSRARSWLHNNQPQARRPLKYSLLPELMPTVDDVYPAMNWLVISPVESAVRWVEADKKSTLNLSTPAITPPFIGEVEIRTRGEDAHLEYIINRYGPIRVVANNFLTVGHILQAIRKYFCTTVDRESFHDVNDRDRFMISHYYHFRTKYQGENIRGTVLPLWDHKKAIRSDLLHGAIKFAGLDIDGEFSRNRTLYLTTKTFAPLRAEY